MRNTAIQHIGKEKIKTYYLHFDEDGDKSQKLLDILMDSLLEFVFGIKHMNTANPQEHQRFFNACERLYKEGRSSQKEGDLGEIILHALLREYVGTIPFTGRFYFAVDENTNPKSFDVIHLLPDENKDILVLGESKMYKAAKGGIDALVDDIRKHFTAEYTRKQFVKISESTYSEDMLVQCNIIKPMKTKIDEWEIKLRDSDTLDGIIDELYVPLLCTYTYDEYANHSSVTNEFLRIYEAEMTELQRYFDAKNYACPECLNIVLMLFPVPNKDALINEYYKRIDEKVKKNA